MITNLMITKLMITKLMITKLIRRMEVCARRHADGRRRVGRPVLPECDERRRPDPSALDHMPGAPVFHVARPSRFHVASSLDHMPGAHALCIRTI